MMRVPIGVSPTGCGCIGVAPNPCRKVGRGSKNYSFSTLSQLLVNGEKRQLSKQIQPDVVGRLLHY